MNEKHTRELIKNFANKTKLILFPNPSGICWVGNSFREGNKTVIIDARRVKYGLDRGASDFIGFKTVEVTKEMIGKKIAVFVAIEAKKPSWRRTGSKHEKEQASFISKVLEKGGIAGFVRDVEDLKSIFGGE